MDHTIEHFLEDHQDYQSIFVGNKKFIDESLSSDPEYFIKLSSGQQPKYLIIGCADSRVPPNYVTKLKPGDIFNHRNIANQVIPGDINVNSVIQYAVLHLKVKHVIVMGHTKCGGFINCVYPELQGVNIGGILDLWISHIKDVYEKYQDDIDEIKDLDAQVDRLSELNVVEQVVNVWKNPYIQSSWLKGHPVWVHGWLFHMENGKLEEIVADKKMPDSFSDAYTFKYEHELSGDKKKLGVTDHIIKPPKKSNRYRQFDDFIHLQTEMMHHIEETPTQIAEFLQNSSCEAIRVNAMEEYKQLKKHDKLHDIGEIVEEKEEEDGKRINIK